MAKNSMEKLSALHNARWSSRGSYAVMQWSPNFLSRGSGIDIFGPPWAKSGD